MATTVFHIEGGIGKNIAATAVTAAYKKAKPKRKIIVITAWPEIWIKNPDISRFYLIGSTPYFYKDVIKDKDVELHVADPYRTTDHITKKMHLIKTWCNMVGIKHNGEEPVLKFNFREIEEGAAYMNQFNDGNRPMMIFQPFGGPGPDHQPHPYSWTRDMHPTQAQEVVNGLAEKYNIVCSITSPPQYNRWEYIRKNCGSPSLPISEMICDRLICLPLHPLMTDQQNEFCCAVLMDAINRIK